MVAATLWLVDRAKRLDVELRARGDGSDQAARSGRAQGIAVPTFKPDPGEMRSVSEPPAASARAFHIKPLPASPPVGSAGGLPLDQRRRPRIRRAAAERGRGAAARGRP